MIVRINGRIWEPATLPEPAAVITITNWRQQVLAVMDQVEAVIKKLLPPPGAMLAAAPVGGDLVVKLWPLVGKLQEFGLAVGIGMSLWGLCRIIMGDPSGKQQIWQSIIGFVGLFVLPEVFFAIWGAFN